MMILWVRKSLNTYVKCKISNFNTSYALNGQYDESAMFFIVVEIVIPDKYAGCSYIKSKLDTIKMSQFKYYLPKSNPHIAECMN